MGRAAAPSRMVPGEGSGGKGLRFELQRGWLRLAPSLYITQWELCPSQRNRIREHIQRFPPHNLHRRGQRKISMTANQVQCCSSALREYPGDSFRKPSVRPVAAWIHVWKKTTKKSTQSQQRQRVHTSVFIHRSPWSNSFWWLDVVVMLKISLFECSENNQRNGLSRRGWMFICVAACSSSSSS